MSSPVPDLPLQVIIGSGGMGTAVARRLAQRSRVAVVDIDSASLTKVTDSINTAGQWAVGIECDVTDAASVATMAKQVDQLGGFTDLAFVTGLSPSAGDFCRILEVNLRGVALVEKALIERAQPGGAAVVVSSMAGHMTQPDQQVIELLRRAATEADLVSQLQAALGPERTTPADAYSLSKWAVIDLVRRAARRWGERGARINSLSPGMIATPMGAAEFAASPHKRALFNLTPLQREGNLAEICDAVEFLLGKKSSFVSGTDLLVDGGLTSAVLSQN